MTRTNIKELLGYCQHSDQRGRPHPAKDVAYAALCRIEELEKEVMSLRGIATMGKRLRLAELALAGFFTQPPGGPTMLMVTTDLGVAGRAYRDALADHFEDEELR